MTKSNRPRPKRPTTVAKNVLRLRLAWGWQQKDLARKSGVSRATVNRVETDFSPPTLDTLARLAKALGVTLGDLVSDPQ